MSMDNLNEVMNMINEEDIKKLFMEYVMLVIAKAEKYDRIMELPWSKEGCPAVKNSGEILYQIGEIIKG